MIPLEALCIHLENIPAIVRDNERLRKRGFPLVRVVFINNAREGRPLASDTIDRDN